MRKAWRAIRSVYYWPSEIVRHLYNLARHGPDSWYRVTAPWIINRGYPDAAVGNRRARPAGWYHFRHQFTFTGEHVIFNIDYARRAADVKGLALIFFMGMGDYFFSTPLIRALKQRYPDLPIIAFASRNAGQVNSPLLEQLLKADPNINEVRAFDGRQTRRYKNYDYRDALRQVPSGYLALPVLYDHLPDTQHRVTSLFETFGLKPPNEPPPPLLHLPPSPPPHVAELLEKIKRLAGQQGARGIVFMQLDARSSHYNYPYADNLTQGLVERGYFVVSASSLSSPPAACHMLDFKQFAIMDSIYLLKLLRNAFSEMYIVSVASVFWSVSAGFGIPNLGMQHFPDDAMHNYWYPNITVITHRPYPKLPAKKQIPAKPGDYELDGRGLAVFLPDYVLKNFDIMISESLHGSQQEIMAQSLRA
ncbi:MAG: glycosyltransferase family 9 protein [Bdellovibrionales bacterium]